jgi:hypothetical protein
MGLVGSKNKHKSSHFAMDQTLSTTELNEGSLLPLLSVLLHYMIQPLNLSSLGLGREATREEIQLLNQRV